MPFINYRHKMIMLMIIIILSACSSQQSSTPPPEEYIPDATAKNVSPKTWYVYPGQSIQDVINSANSDDKVVLMPGLHEHDVRYFDAVVYIDKAIDLEIMKGAELKAVLKNEHITGPFIITNHSPRLAEKTDFIVNSAVIPQQAVSYLVQVMPEGIRWSVSSSTTPSRWWGESIPIEPGMPINLNDGISITPTKTLSVGTIYFIIFESQPYHVIRVGNGLQSKYISRVNIHGEGTVDANIFNNNGVQTGHAISLSSGILINGRVRNVTINGLTLLNNQRSIQVYSEHTGNYASNGETIDGISYNAENISIDNIKVDKSLDGFLIGHPEHRGKTSNVSITNNNINVSSVAIEPNFRLSGFTVSSNIIRSRYSNFGICLWRGPANGTVSDNSFSGNTIGTNQCVIIASPVGWPEASNINLSNNTVIP